MEELFNFFFLQLIGFFAITLLSELPAVFIGRGLFYFSNLQSMGKIPS